MQSISLADELTLEHAPRGGGAATRSSAPASRARPTENLAARALAAFRAATGWDAPPLRLTIVKRIPVAAGLGGGSADAAAALRLAAHASGLGDDALLRELGAALGADVPAQIAPGRWLAGGAGELLEALPDPNPASFGLLVLPAAAGLSTAEVYAEADRLGSRALRRGATGAPPRSAQGARAERGGAARRASCWTTTCSAAAISLCPEIAAALAQAREAGAEHRACQRLGADGRGAVSARQRPRPRDGRAAGLRPIGDRPACPRRSAPRR